MESKQKTVITWTVVVLAAAWAINKFKVSLGFGNSFNPTDKTVISSVWYDSPQSHKKYTYSMKSDEANNLSEDIYSALGAFTDNFTKVFTDFQKCNTQGDAYAISLFFRNNYDANLWESMVNGFGVFPWSGFSSEQLKEINDYILSLPL